MARIALRTLRNALITGAGVGLGYMAGGATAHALAHSRLGQRLRQHPYEQQKKVLQYIGGGAMAATGLGWSLHDLARDMANEEDEEKWEAERLANENQKVASVYRIYAVALSQR